MTFGSFSCLAKVHPGVVALWSKELRDTSSIIVSFGFVIIRAGAFKSSVRPRRIL